MTQKEDCVSPRLKARGMCSCDDPERCPYSEKGRARILADLEAQGKLDENGQVRR